MWLTAFADNIRQNILCVSVFAGFVIKVSAEKIDAVVIKHRIYANDIFVRSVFVEIAGNCFVRQRPVLTSLTFRTVGCAIWKPGAPAAFIRKITYGLVPGALAILAYPAFGIYILATAEKTAE